MSGKLVEGQLMDNSLSDSSRAWTHVGLAIALFGIPAVVTGYLFLAPEHSAVATIVREMLIIGLTGTLLWIVAFKERLPMASIGLSVDRLGRSLLWSIVLTMIIFAVLVAVLALFGALGIHYGEGQGSTISPSIWITLLTVVRAGISEEIFYRGYAIERLQAMT
jgi:membrane protease YdiL (CAAX protease family)